jgi:hypothetical protein
MEFRRSEIEREREENGGRERKEIEDGKKERRDKVCGMVEMKVSLIRSSPSYCINGFAL